jgi:soluble P-type ATPase
MHFSIPGSQEPLIINSLILDLNGTLAVDGKIVEGVAERLQVLRDRTLKLFLFTGDTHGNAGKIANDLGLEVRVTKNAYEKAKEAMTLDPATCATIGNGKIDEKLFQTVRLRIATLQAEGVHIQTLLASDIVVPNINDALDLFIHEKRLIATLRS